SCLWYRSRLESFSTGRLEGRAAGATGAHVARCTACRGVVEATSRMQALVLAASTSMVEPDWSSFWPGIHSRLATEAARPLRDAWWLPWWKPVWGHPRLATSAALALVLALGTMFWPGSNEVTRASASPIVVQDVATADPRGTVMVYSNKDSDVTVIWLFADAGATDR